MHQKTMAHLHNGILLSRKEELLPFATAWRDMKSIMLSEISQVVKDKHHIISPRSGIYQPNKQMSKIEPETLKLRTIL